MYDHQCMLCIVYSSESISSGYICNWPENSNFQHHCKGDGLAQWRTKPSIVPMLTHTRFPSPKLVKMLNITWANIDPYMASPKKLKRMPQNLDDEKATLVQIMVWCDPLPASMLIHERHDIYKAPMMIDSLQVILHVHAHRIKVHKHVLKSFKFDEYFK